MSALLKRIVDGRGPRRATALSVSRSHVGRVRAINEDRVLDAAHAGVWAIVDGMGGHDGGDLAAQQVVDALRAAIGGSAQIRPSRVWAALHAAHEAIGQRNRRLGLNAGATAVAATLHDDMVEIAWAGDSRAYLLHDGRAEPLTRDHSVVQELIDAGLLTTEAAAAHPQANVVTRALGIGNLQLERARIPARGRVLLCSDGLSRSLRDDDIVASATLTTLAEHLLGRALARDGTDNVSLVIIDFA